MDVMEIVIVICIISILGGLIVPAINRAGTAHQVYSLGDKLDKGEVFWVEDQPYFFERFNENDEDQTKSRIVCLDSNEQTKSFSLKTIREKMERSEIRRLYDNHDIMPTDSAFIDRHPELATKVNAVFAFPEGTTVRHRLTHQRGIVIATNRDTATVRFETPEGLKEVEGVRAPELREAY